MMVRILGSKGLGKNDWLSRVFYDPGNGSRGRQGCPQDLCGHFSPVVID